MKNDLFNQTLLKKYGKNFKLTLSKHDLIKDYLSKLVSGVFKSETKNYLRFYDIILKGLLEYPGENVLFDEKEDTGTGKSEFVLQSDDKKFMIIELKGQGIDLDKKQSGRSDNKSPVEQAFGYAINTGDVEWIMVSNYDEFRLYNYHEKTKYISFNAEELLNKDIFSFFMATFSYKSHVQSGYVQKIHEGTLLVDRKLASEFYKLYNETRLMLIKELEINSGCQRLDAIHYAQLILNRYMFICFAEDTGLLPSQVSIGTIATPIQKGNLRHNSIWQRLNELFLDINEGNEFKKISAYNGGFFQEDLGSLKIRDIVDDQSIFQDTYQDWKFELYEKDIEHLLGNVKERVNPIYRNMLTISSFDFSSELDVNILGHIFENSIGDIEELKEDTKGRRKKEGIFYTPDYITDYICRNTIIPYLSKSGKADNVTDLIDEYSWSRDIEDLDQKVKEIKIVDPACGSGAFLNKATDILLDIHEAIFDFKRGYTKTTDMRVGKGKRRRTESIQHTDLGAYVFDHIEKRREILLNNIYGVDLNEESVEITKLSLFLKVCRKDLKLPNLDKNIKCGNSLIDDPEFTDKAFKWDEEFSEIFAKGGFDIVIGNPPYINIIKIPKNQLPYLKEHYKSAEYGRIDLYLIFMEKALDILNTHGLTSFIIPDKFCTNKYASNLRKIILENFNIHKLVNLEGFKIFSDAVVDNIIYVFEKDLEINQGNVLKIIRPFKEHLNNNKIEGQTIELNQSLFNEMPENMFRLRLTPENWEILKKIRTQSQRIEEICYVSFGLQPGKLNKFVFNKYQNPERINENPSVIKNFIRGRNIKRYRIDYTGDLVFYLPKELHRPAFPQLFENEKISISEISKDIKATYDDSGYYGNEKTVQMVLWTSLINLDGSILKGRGINLTEDLLKNSEKYALKYILAFLNSNLVNFFFKILISDGLNVFPDNIRKLPIFPASNEEQEPFIEKADLMLDLNQQLQEEVNGFKHWIEKEFNVDKMSKKLEKYYELSEDEFIDELRKKKVDTKSRKNREYLEREFNESLAIIKPLLREIEETDNEIDQMVYELYGLTDDEVKIIEEGISNGS